MTALPESVSELLNDETNPSNYFLPPGDTYVVTDTAANIEALTAAQISAAPSVSVSGIAATDTSVVLTVAQAFALEGASLIVTVPTGDAITVADTAAKIEGLTAAQMTALKSLGVTAIAATDTAAVLTGAQMAALAGASIPVTAPPGGSQNDGTTVISGPHGGGLTFDISWDPSVASAPANFKTDVEEAFQFYQTRSAPQSRFITLSDMAKSAAPRCRATTSVRARVITVPRRPTLRSYRS